MKYLFVIASLLLSLSAFSQVNTCGETGPGNSCTKSKLICAGSYSDFKNDDDDFEFSKALVQENAENNYISASSSYKTNDGLFEVIGHASVYDKDVTDILVDVTDLRTGMSSKSYSLKNKAEIIVTEEKGTKVTKMLSLECRVE